MEKRYPMFAEQFIADAMRKKPEYYGLSEEE